MTKPVLPGHIDNADDARPEKMEEVMRRLREAPRKNRGSEPPSPSRPATGGSQPPEDAAHVDEALFAAGHEGEKGKFPVLIAVFMLSAVAGGALAGFYLSRNASPAKPPVLSAAALGPVRNDTAKDGVEKREPQTPASKETLVVKSAPASAGGNEKVSSGKGDDEPKTAGGKVEGKDNARLVEDPPAAATVAAAPAAAPPPVAAEPVPAPPPVTAEPAAAKPPAPEGKPADAPVEGGTAALVTLTESQPDGKADGSGGNPEKVATIAGQPVEEKPAGAEATAPTAEAPVTMEAGSEDLEALTSNVVRALGGLTRQDAGEQGSMDGADGEASAAEDLRGALSALVNKAMSEGRSRSEIAAMIDEAIERAGPDAVPEELLGADGKVNLNLLLASVIPMEEASRASRQNDDYVSLLRQEGENTSLKEAADNKGRFYMRGGKRYTRIRRGDTLGQIAFDAYGDVLAYPRILRANGGKLSVRKMKPGMEIRVPGKGEAITSGGPVDLRKIATSKRGKRARAKRPAGPRRGTAARRRATAKAVAKNRNGKRTKISDRLLGSISSRGASAKPLPAGEKSVTTNFTTARKPANP